MPRKFLQRILQPLLRPLMRHYTGADRTTQFAGLQLTVRQGVFHPRLFFSTLTLWRWLDRLPLSGQPLLEIGSGSGALALAAARKGALVTATDISAQAIACITANANAHHLNVHIVQSDLFDALPAVQYRWIVVNPPFYPRDPQTEAERAWFCGEGHSYFHRFFAGAAGFLQNGGEVLMVLSDDCDLDTIREIARNTGWTATEVYRRKLLLECNFVFRFVPAGAGDAAEGKPKTVYLGN